MKTTRTPGIALLTAQGGERFESITLKEAVDAVVATFGELSIPKPLDYDAAPVAELTTSTPYVADKGYLNFIGGWHVFAGDGGSAAWVRAIAPAGVGKLEIWLKSLTAGKTYLVSIDAGSMVGGPSPGFEIRSSAGQAAVVQASPPFQPLLAIIQPDGPMALVTVEPRDLETWIFFKARAFEL